MALKMTRRRALAAFGCVTCSLLLPSTTLAQHPPQNLPRCPHTLQKPGFLLTGETRATYLQSTVDVCLDRSSFLDH